MNLRALYGSALFSGIDIAALDRMFAKHTVRRIRKGELVLEQGRRCNEVFVLIQGRIEIFYTSSSKISKVVAVQDAPAICGMLEIWQKHENLANVRAAKDCSMIVLSLAEYLSLLQSNHQFSINVIRLTSNMFCETGQNRRLDQFGSVQNLLANTLCTLVKLEGVEQKQGAVISKINKSDLARIMGIARKSVIRAFDGLEDEGLIRTDKQDVIVPDLSALQKRAWAL